MRKAKLASMIAIVEQKSDYDEVLIEVHDNESITICKDSELSSVLVKNATTAVKLLTLDYYTWQRANVIQMFLDRLRLELVVEIKAEKIVSYSLKEKHTYTNVPDDEIDVCVTLFRYMCSDEYWFTKCVECLAKDGQTLIARGMGV